MITTFNILSNMPQIYSEEKATQRHTDYVYRVIEKTACPLLRVICMSFSYSLLPQC